jgi:D-alanyl-lipoteichoic acid acyltransferase DltB (MBOAT superfamily)
MYFNSFEFGIFLPIVFMLYWFVSKKNIQFQNIILIIASYIFYGWWDWRFLGLIIGSSLIDFIIGLALENENNNRRRKLLLFTSLFINLGALAFFKYFNFFIENFKTVFTFFGHPIDGPELNIILPVGISFYTFQTLSYSIDVYRRKLKATHSLTNFLAFVSFFPQLVAGPIERATHLLPQFSKKRQFDYSKAVDGSRQILWGFFKKVVIADNCAEIVNQIFDGYQTQSGLVLILGAVLFAFQIYGDFSGYSDIAVGLSRLFGFDLMQNFNFPYFSRDIADFWRRWHISLSTWFRDYLYIPLGGSRGSNYKKIRNVFIIFIVSGFWHGANWTFIIWGALNALYFLPLLLTNRNRKNTQQNIKLESKYHFLSILGTFMLTCLAWIFFRANSVQQANEYIYNIFKQPFIGNINFKYELTIITPLLIFFIINEWIHRNKKHGLQINKPIKRFYLWSYYTIIIFLTIIFAGNPQEFIYFQF